MKRILAGFVISAGLIFGQSGFDVVSIKPSDPLSNVMHIGISPSGSFEASGANLMSLIVQAYDVRGFQIVGGTGWMNDEKYTIVTKDEAKEPARAEQSQLRDRMNAKLRAMLADRFQLRVHRETREMPVFALTIAKGGIRMKASATDAGDDAGINMTRTDEAKSGVIGKQVPMDVLSRFLSFQVARTVMDETGLKGKYDFRLVYSPGLGDTTGPSLFTALQEQLGLKLESKKGPVEVIVIDGAEIPSEN